jgi:hypothetical protein
VTEAYESSQASNAEITLSVLRAVRPTADSGRGTAHLLEQDVIMAETWGYHDRPDTPMVMSVVLVGEDT